jgi:hypothetical protein
MSETNLATPGAAWVWPLESQGVWANRTAKIKIIGWNALKVLAPADHDPPMPPE